MKLTVSTILSALLLASVTQAAPVDPHSVDRRDFVEEQSQIAQSIAAGLQSFASHVRHHGYHHQSTSGLSDGRNAAAIMSSEWVPQGSSTAGVAGSSSSSSSPSSSSSDSGWSWPLPWGSSSSDGSSATSGSSSSSSSSPSSSSSSSSSSSASPSSTGSSGNSTSSNSPLSGKPKLGLAWPNGGSMNINNWITNKVSWYYSWDPTPGWKNAPTNITFCPMLWGDKSVSSFRKHVLNNLDGKNNQGKCVMGMNEVNQRGQAKMTVSHACSLMRENVLPLKKHGWYIVSPVTTSAPNGQTWMDNFRSNCGDVWEAIDAVAVHYYDTSINKFKNYVTEWHNRYSKPIWVTEYACQNFNGGSQCSDSKAYNFHTTMASWFDEQDFVEAYAPFGVMQNMQGVASSNELANGQNPTTLYSAISE